MTDPSQHCALCDRPVGETTVEEGDLPFCSTGCRQVGAEFGVGELPEEPIPERTREGGGSEDATTERTFLHVDGMHCVTCETFLESVATKQDGVVDAAASYVTETIRIEYDPATVSPPELSGALTTVGYTVTPREELATVADERQRRPDQRQLDDLLAFRYAAGVLVGLFMLFPYVVVFYPAHAAEVFGFSSLGLFTSGPGPGDGILILPLFLSMTSIVLFFTGLPLLRGAYVSLRVRQPNTDLLVALTIVSAYLYGTVAFLSGDINVYYDTTIVIAAVVVAAIFYESLVKRRAVDRLTELTVSQVERARLLDPDGSTRDVEASELEGGDRILVPEGERVPVDGILDEGHCTVDESVVTGESLPVRKEPGEPLVGGSIVTEGAATIRVGDPPTSSIDDMTTAVWDLQSGTHGIQRYSDRLAARIAPALVAVAVVVGIVTYALGGGVLGATFALLGAVLVLSPWGVGFSTPLSVARSIEAAMERGIVVFDETVFERLRETDVVVFDKTGTLTTGEMDLLEADCPPELLSAAAKLERHTTHPAGEAIVAAVGEDVQADGGAEPPSAGTDGEDRSDTAYGVRDVRSHDEGIEGDVDGRHLLVGTLSLFAERGWAVGEDLRARTIDHRERGQMPVVIGREGSAEGLVVLGDDPRRGWEETMRTLADRDIETVVLTGDDEAATARFGDHPDVDFAFAGVAPAGKTATIRRLRERGHVTMVGDGTNDGPALAAADLGISLGGGTALASEAADLTILDDDLGRVGTAFELAAGARRLLVENTALALTYNAVAVPLFVLGVLNPLFVMGTTVLTTSLVGANALRPLIE